uniref:Solute carrier family 6 member 18 n=1 Tax=Catharus ustulatus TaxID=91951 RepID=A0A8C3URC6_CATUS
MLFLITLLFLSAFTTQIFFSLSLAFGGLIAFASYNPTKNDCEKDAVTVAIVNSMTSLYASIPVFSVLGFKATTAYWDYLNILVLGRLNQNKFGLNCVSGTGLAFIVFTQAIVLMPGSQAWAILFFIMLFSLGLSSMFGNIEGVFTPLLELQIISESAPKELLSGIICLISFLIALCFTLGSGSYWIDIFDRYAGSVPLLVIAFFEVIGVTYIYKIKRFSKDVEWMTGRKLNLYWQITWRFISPLLLLIVFTAFVILQMQKPPSYTAWNPKYVCCQIFSELLIKGRIIFLPYQIL